MNEQVITSDNAALVVGPVVEGRVRPLLRMLWASTRKACFWLVAAHRRGRNRGVMPPGRRVASALDVAAYIVQLARESARTVDQVGVLKLLYFAQGTALARLGRRIFWEKIKAWPLGPVVPQVWKETTEYGKESVQAIGGGDPGKLSEDDRAIVDCVWQEYGGESSLKLVDLTHEPGPWKTVRDTKRLAEGERSTEEIPVSLIESHFTAQLPDPFSQEEKLSFPRLA